MHVREALEKKLSEYDVNQTRLGKYGGSLQGFDKEESSTSRKIRTQLESNDERLRVGINKSYQKLLSLVAGEVEARKNFLQAFSSIFNRAAAVERRRLDVITQAFELYIDTVEKAEPLNPRREAVIKYMRDMAASFVDVHMKRFNKWAKERTKTYTFQLFTANWRQYGLGIVTNNVADVEIPANLQIPSDTDLESSDEASPSTSNPPSPPDEGADQAEQGTSQDSQESEQAQSESSETTTDQSKDRSRPKVRVIMCGPSKEGLSNNRFKANRRKVGPRPSSPKSSVNGWKTLPDRSDNKGKRKSQDSSVGGATYASSEEELESMHARKEQCRLSGSRGVRQSDNFVQRDTITSPTRGTREWIPYTGTDHPYYAEGDPEDLETFVLPESITKRPPAPFAPMINNWMDPNVLPKKSESSHKRLNQFLKSTKAKFLKSSKKSSKTSKKPASPEKPASPAIPASPDIEYTETIPVDFGRDDVDKVSTPIPPPPAGKSKRDKAQPITCPSKSEKKPKKAAPTPKPGGSEETPKKAEASESQSDDPDILTLMAKRHSVTPIKTYSVATYEARDEDEISFTAGQTVKLLFPANSKGMAFGYIRADRMHSRQYGLFPEELVIRKIEERHRSIRKNINGFFKKR